MHCPKELVACLKERNDFVDLNLIHVNLMCRKGGFSFRKLNTSSRLESVTGSYGFYQYKFLPSSVENSYILLVRKSAQESWYVKEFGLCDTYK